MYKLIHYHVQLPSTLACVLNISAVFMRWPITFSAQTQVILNSVVIVLSLSVKCQDVASNYVRTAPYSSLPLRHSLIILPLDGKQPDMLTSLIHKL